MDQLLRGFRNLVGPVADIGAVDHMHDHRMVGRPSLQREDTADRLGILGVGTQPVDRLGRESDQLPRLKQADGFIEFSSRWRARRHRVPCVESVRDIGAGYQSGKSGQDMQRLRGRGKGSAGRLGMLADAVDVPHLARRARIALAVQM